MKFKEIVDFQDLFDSEKYVIDWEQLDNYPFFKDLSKTLTFYNEIGGKLEALKTLQDILDGQSISHILTNESFKAFFERSKNEMETILSYEARILDTSLADFLEDKYLLNDEDKLNYVLKKEAEQIEEIIDSDKIVFKKGWFREPENEAFYDEIIERLPSLEVLKKFYNLTEEGNRADIYNQFDIHLKRYFNDGDLEKIYMKHSRAVAENSNTDNDELSIDDLDGAMRQIVIESILYASKIAFDEEYAKKELEFYKVQAHSKEEERDAEAHGEVDIDSSSNYIRKMR